MPDRLSSTFAALADPTRRAILARLASAEASVTELAKPFEMSMPAVSKHLKVLQRAGLIARGREAQWRPCRLEAGPLKDVADWVEYYRRFWEESLDRLEAYLRELKNARGTSGAAGPSEQPFAADSVSQGFSKSAQAASGGSKRMQKPSRLVGGSESVVSESSKSSKSQEKKNGRQQDKL